MSCQIIELRTQLLPDYPPGGSWVFDGYNANDPNGSPGAGGSDPGTLFGDNPSVNFGGFVPGYYFFTYTPDPDTCVGPKQAVVWVQERLSAGTPVNVDLCLTNEDVIDLNDTLIGADPGGEWSLNPGSPDDPGSAFNDPNLDTSLLSGPGVFMFDYLVDVIEEGGFERVNCIICRSIATVTISVIDACDPGQDATIEDPTGAFDLFTRLSGTPDIGGTWTQISGETVTISGDYLGTINLNAANGCLFEFQYECEAPSGCQSTAVVTVIKNPGFTVTIQRSGNSLASSVSGCGGTVTYQWQKLVSGVWTDVSGATSATLSNPENQSLYRLRATCQGCPKFSNEIYFEIICDCEAIGIGVTLNESTGCLTLAASGQNCDGVASDVIQYRRKPNGNWTNYVSPICGCNLFEYLDVNPTCHISGSNIQIGFNNVQKCLGTVDRVTIKWGNNTVQTWVGNFNTGFAHQVSATNMVNVYNRTAEVRIRLNVNGVYLFQIINVYYSGGTSNPTCGQVSQTKANFPRYYYPLDIRRTITFNNGCPPIEFNDDWENNTCELLFVQLAVGNVNGQPAVIASVFNDTGCNYAYTYQWYRNGVLLSGQNSFWVNRQTFGEGFYEVVVTCGDCTANDTIQTSTCTVTVTVTGPVSGTYTATVNNCAGSKTYYWERLVGGSWTNVKTTTTTSNTDTLTPTVNGSYRVRVVCAANNCENAAYFDRNVQCAASVTISNNSGVLTATPANCPATISYQWARWNGTSWVNVGTNSANYTPTQSGLYRVVITCGDGCTAEAQISVTISCTLDVTLAPPSGNTYTASVTGCTGNRTWFWERWNGNAWVIQQQQTNSNSTNSFTPTQFGIHRIRVVCAADGCDDSQTFEYSECNVSVVITRNNNLLTANPTGCNGSIVYTWYYRAVVGQGSWGSPISNSQTINTNTWGDGEYRVVVQCSGCTAEATYPFSSCDYSLTVNCANSNPFTAQVSGCAGTVTYQWQYSPTGFGWSNLGTQQTQMPVNGAGFYRVTSWCNGVCPKSVTCQYTPPCNGSAVIDPVFNGIDWEVYFNSSGLTESIELYFNGGGPQVTGNYNLSQSSGRTALKTAIETWLDGNGGGTVTVGYDRNIGYISISCTRAILDRARLGGINFWSGDVGRTCDYSITVADSHFVGLYINDKFWYSTANPLPFATQSTQIRDIILDLFVQAGLGATSVTVNSNGTIVIEGFYGSMGRATGSAGANQSVNHYSAVRTSCDAISFRYPELTADITGCQGNMIITWRYRPVPGSGQWNTIQTGGMSLFTCTEGEYQLLVSCGGCDYDDEYEFMFPL